MFWRPGAIFVNINTDTSKCLKRLAYFIGQGRLLLCEKCASVRSNYKPSKPDNIMWTVTVLKKATYLLGTNRHGSVGYSWPLNCLRHFWRIWFNVNRPMRNWSCLLALVKRHFASSFWLRRLKKTRYLHCFPTRFFTRMPSSYHKFYHLIAVLSRMNQMIFISRGVIYCIRRCQGNNNRSTWSTLIPRGRSSWNFKENCFLGQYPSLRSKLNHIFFFHLQSDTDENFRSRHMDFNEIRTFPVNRFTALIEAQNLWLPSLDFEKSQIDLYNGSERLLSFHCFNFPRVSTSQAVQE